MSNITVNNKQARLTLHGVLGFLKMKNTLTAIYSKRPHVGNTTLAFSTSYGQNFLWDLTARNCFVQLCA